MTPRSRSAIAAAARPENDSAGRAAADWSVALDDLKASLPNVNRVFLVVGWFGDDLRCGSCTIRPKVEVADKVTTPDAWTVHGIARANAAVVSLHQGRPSHGGTPSDDSIVRAIRDLKAHGISVVVYPFLFMDVPAGNALPSPYGGVGQPAYPWRGRPAILLQEHAGRPDPAPRARSDSLLVGSRRRTQFRLGDHRPADDRGDRGVDLGCTALSGLARAR